MGGVWKSSISVTWWLNLCNRQCAIVTLLQWKRNMPKYYMTTASAWDLLIQATGVEKPNTVCYMIIHMFLCSPIMTHLSTQQWCITVSPSGPFTGFMLTRKHWCKTMGMTLMIHWLRDRHAFFCLCVCVCVCIHTHIQCLCPSDTQDHFPEDFLLKY